MILRIKSQEAQELCDEYAAIWKTGTTTCDPSATWLGWFDQIGRLCGALGYHEEPQFARRHILSWHVSSTKSGKIAARDLLAFARSTMREGWIMVGTIVPGNRKALDYIASIGGKEAAIIVTLEKENMEVENGRNLRLNNRTKSKSRRCQRCDQRL